MTERTEPSLLLSLIPVVGLVAMLIGTIVGLDGTGHLPLIGGTVLAGAVASFGLKRPWSEIQKGMIGGITGALPAILILLVVGLLIGSWIASGVVPLMVFWGLKILAPSWFLVASLFICAVVSLATGSSWSTAATVGLALIGVGQALGMHPGMTAGAIVSGAYFGDKMSPLSDTTNLSPAVAGAELFEHIQHMLWTTVPGLVVAAIVFTVLGLRGGGAGEGDSAVYTAIVTGLEGGFELSPILILAPALVLTLVIKKVPALPALMAGVLAGAVLGVLVQPNLDIAGVMAAMYGGYESATGVASVDDLLSRGGLSGMLDTIALVVCALAFAGVMEGTDMLDRLAAAVLSWARSTGSLVAATIASCIGLNVLASDQYIAIVVPGRMYRTAYLKRGLHPKNLSRTLEDSGTLTSALVPWNTCGAYMAGVLGVGTLAYAPFAIVNWVVPMISLGYGITGFSFETIDEADAEARIAA
ncbi:MAG: Na+/H+ antiporter NhaC [Proteobacteria bacterium]|nr:Na+/H+ antiporter NhaC [Pseudomonadota bacterium]